MTKEETLSAGNDTLALDCHDLSARHGPITVLTSLHLKVRAGECLCLLGPNGAGKSSLIGALAGYVKGTGKVTVADSRVDGLPVHRRAKRGLSIVPEGRGNLLPVMTVREHLQLAVRTANSGERAVVMDELLDLFPILSERMGQAAGTMSGGEQQMLSIAMALARKPSVLVLDEPSQCLAPTVLVELSQVFEVLKRRGIGLLVAEQNQSFAERIADRFVVMANGQIVRHGTRSELTRENLAEAYLTT